jgi:CubicO group peptidase (beta-lactamase class C family)
MNLCKIKFYLILLFTSLTFLFSCSENTNEPTQSSYTYNIPEQVNDGWKVGSISSVGLTAEPLVNMMEYLNGKDEHRIHSIIIIKDSTLVLEEYFADFYFDTDHVQSEGEWIEYDRNTLHFMASVTKSFTSVLFGIAMDEGLIQSVDETVISHYPAYSSFMTDQKADITIKHLLTMSAGLAWDENTYPFGDSRNDVTGLFQSSDPIKFILQKTLESTPGSRFHYNSGYTNVLADIIRRQNGINLKQYAEQKLFGPLGITSYRLDMLTSRLAFASGGLYLGVRDLAKIGQLYLNDGVWNGNRIVSKEWVTESTQSYINPNYGFANGYGYQWWLDNFAYNGKVFNFYFAAGWGGQYMYLLPQENMIIVITCGYFLTQETVSAQELIADYILASIN